MPRDWNCRMGQRFRQGQDRRHAAVDASAGTSQSGQRTDCRSGLEHLTVRAGSASRQRDFHADADSIAEQLPEFFFERSNGQIAVVCVG